MRWIALLWSTEILLFVTAFWRWRLQFWQVASHIAVIVVLSLAMVAAAICLLRGVRSRVRASVGCGVVLGTFFTAIVAFHATVFLALNAWGQLPTLDLVTAYLRELPFLKETLGISPWFVWPIAAATWVSLVTLHTVLILASTSSSLHGASGMSRISRIRLLLAGLFAFGVVPVALAAYMTNIDAAALSEPLYVAVNGDVWHRAQTNSTSRLRIQQLQRLDDMARRSYVPGSVGKRRNVVLITVDALRPDHMSLYGYGRQTTPNLDRMAREGRLAFASVAHSPCAESFCGLLSLLTGKQGHKLAAQDFGLVEILKLHGYARYAVLSGDHARFYGLRERYGPFDTFSDGGSLDNGNSMNDDASVLAKLAKLPHASDQPAFLFIHLMSAHGLGAKHPKFQRWLPAKSVYNLRVQRVDTELIGEVHNGYDNGVLQSDSIISEVLKTLEERGYLENAITFVTGDHGDFLGEHNMFSHSRTVLEPVLRVPWIWISSDAAALRLDRPVVHADFAPTVLKMLNIPIPDNWDGCALQDCARLSYSFHQQAQFAALIDYTGGRRIKYIYDRSTRSERVYDLIEDPSETLDLAATTTRAQISIWQTELTKEQLIRPHVCESGAVSC